MRDREELQISSESEQTTSGNTTEDLGQRLDRLRQHSEDGKVRGRIKRIEQGDDYVTFVITRLSDIETVEQTFSIPDTWDDSSQLARVLDGYGYDPANIELMEGEEVELDRSFGGWYISVPDSDSGRFTRFRIALAIGGLLFGGLYVPLTIHALLTGDVFLFILASVIIIPLGIIYFGAVFFVMSALSVYEMVRRYG